MALLLEKYLSVIKHLIPQKAVTPSVGLDIGVHSCKLLEVFPSGDSFEIIRWGIEPIGKDSVETVVSRLFKRLNIQTKDVYTAVSGKGTLIRYIDMPRMAMEELRKSFELESDKYFPFARDQIYTDCYILDQKGKDKQMQVLIAASKKEIINERLQLLTKLGFQPNFISINPIAISNVFNILGQKIPGNDYFNLGSKSSSVAILEMGESVSNLIILVDNQPRFTRDLFIGGQELTKRMSNVLGISVEEAEKLKVNPGSQIQEVLAACDSVLVNLISEIRLSFDYFTTENNAPISKLFLTGGASLLEGLRDLFSKNLDIPVERWDPIASLKIASGLSVEDIRKNSSYLGVALGLALYHHD